MKFVLLVIVTFLSPSLKADPGVFDRGNGGDVVFCRSEQGKSQYLLLDIYEQRNMGFHRWQPSLPEDYTFHEVLEAVFSRIDQKLPYLASKLREEYFGRFAQDLTFVAPEDVPDVDDQGPVILEPHCNLKQIAVQWSEKSKYGKAYRIDITLFSLLDPYNQGALILHELIYRIKLSADMLMESSQDVRTNVSYILSKEFDQFPGYNPSSY
ncbi:hypothetical protein ACLVWU_08395 [Bdellovibrio sp. HCB290]|uniref:hypothetical protein n=1 Tax=Bdellovibrio sp. HCB290 TaxID=3394356 RepID=UPI0039B5832B